MATQSTTDLNEAMKIVFAEPMVNNVVTDTELLALIPDGGGIKTDQTTGGRYIETAQMFRLPAGVGARSEGDYIPIPTSPSFENSRINLKKVMGTTEMNAEVLKKVRTSEAAFIDWADRALPSLVERVTHEVDRMMLGYGAGIKARVNAATPATNLVVDSGMGIANTPDYLLQFLEGETLIASPNANGTSPRTGAMQVTAVDFDNDYIVVDALAAALANNDFLFAGDTAGNSSGTREPMGIYGAVDDGSVVATFQNIVRATFPQWRSFVQDAQASPFAAGQQLTEQLIMYCDDQVYIRGGGKIDLFVCSRKGTRQFWTDLVGDRSINDPRSFMGGKSKVGMLLGDRTVTLKTARKCPATVAFGITLSTFTKYMLHEWQWDDTTGSIWRQVSDATGRKDAFFSYGSLYMEIGNGDPQKNFRIENLDVTGI
jgi:hypothetical protein